MGGFSDDLFGLSRIARAENRARVPDWLRFAGWQDNYYPIDDSPEAMLEWVQHAITRLRHARENMAIANDEDDREVWQGVTSELVHDGHLLTDHLRDLGWRNLLTHQSKSFSLDDGIDDLRRLRDVIQDHPNMADQQPEDEGKPAIEVPTPHEQLLKWAQVTLGNSKEGTLLERIVAQGVTDKSKLRDALDYDDSDTRAFNTLLGVVNKKLKQGKKSRKLDAFYWLDGNNRNSVKLLAGDDAKVRHAT